MTPKTIWQLFDRNFWLVLMAPIAYTIMQELSYKLPGKIYTLAAGIFLAIVILLIIIFFL